MCEAHAQFPTVDLSLYLNPVVNKLSPLLSQLLPVYVPFELVTVELTIKALFFTFWNIIAHSGAM